jgi:hypothetical protein
MANPSGFGDHTIETTAGGIIKQIDMKQIVCNDNVLAESLFAQPILLNGGFELDTNNDGVPDNWVKSNNGSFSRSTDTKEGFYSAKIDATNADLNDYCYLESDWVDMARLGLYFQFAYKTDANNKIKVVAVYSNNKSTITEVTVLDWSGEHETNTWNYVISKLLGDYQYVKLRVGIVKTASGSNIVYFDACRLMHTPPPMITHSMLIQSCSGSTTLGSFTDVASVIITTNYICNFNIILVIQGYVYVSSGTGYLRAKVGSNLSNSYSTTSTAEKRHMLQLKFNPALNANSGTYRKQFTLAIQAYNTSGGTTYAGKDAVGFYILEP